jgi:hypothetical protein
LREVEAEAEAKMKRELASIPLHSPQVPVQKGAEIET